MSTLKGETEQRNKDKYTGEITEAYIMKLNSVNSRKVIKNLVPFYTNATAHLMKRFNSSDENYAKHIECFGLSRELE
jgi:hypothetical protein